MSSRRSRTSSPGARPRRAWQEGDTIPAPEAVQSDGESAWALWQQVAQQHEAGFAPTQPLTVPLSLKPEEVAWAPTQPAGPLRGARQAQQQLVTLEAAILVARRNNRVCPRLDRWTEFRKLLPARKTATGVSQPPPALTGAQWDQLPSLTKRMLFRDQIEWAEHTGVLAAALEFMQRMAEQDWLHMGES
jgi:hypothetical protein